MCAFCFRSKLTQQHRVPLERMASLALTLRPGLSGVQLVRMISRYARSDEFAAELNAKMALRGVSAAELCAAHDRQFDAIRHERAEWAERVAAGERAFSRLLDDTRLKVGEARARVAHLERELEEEEIDDAEHEQALKQKIRETRRLARAIAVHLLAGCGAVSGCSHSPEARACCLAGG